MNFPVQRPNPALVLFAALSSAPGSSFEKTTGRETGSGMVGATTGASVGVTTGASVGGETGAALGSCEVVGAREVLGAKDAVGSCEIVGAGLEVA